MAERVFIDCSTYPSEKNCSLYLSGTPEEVIAVARKHAVDAHGHEDTVELVEMLKSSMKPEAVTV